jgi:hypothetical protein
MLKFKKPQLLTMIFIEEEKRALQKRKRKDITTVDDAEERHNGDKTESKGEEDRNDHIEEDKQESNQPRILSFVRRSSRSRQTVLDRDERLQKCGLDEYGRKTTPVGNDGM